MASETVADLREEIRDHLDQPDYARGGESGFRSGTLSRLGKELDLEHVPGSAPMTRRYIRDDLGLELNAGGAFRKAELVAIRDALQEGDDAE